LGLLNQEIKILKPSTNEEWISGLKLIEKAYRICYKTEDKITENSYKTFIPLRIKHESPLEHMTASVEILTNRATAQEITRHRLASYSIESTRWINYNKKYDGNLTFIKPQGFDSWNAFQQITYEAAFANAQRDYNALVCSGLKHENARDVLPLGFSSNIIMTANFREWRHIFRLRALDEAAHPDIRALFQSLLEQFKEYANPVFGDLI
jgi:thymidylate synthase (FAD)